MRFNDASNQQITTNFCWREPFATFHYSLLSYLCFTGDVL